MLASTAPTARSGVSITATSFGGAVKTAARPNLKGKWPGFEPAAELWDGLDGTRDVLDAEVLSDNLPFVTGVGGANEVRRVIDAEEERERVELVRGRLIANADGG